MKMNLFDLFARKRQPEIDRHARELYEMLRDEKYTESPYQKEDMGDDMWIVKQLMWDYWKPRYMVDERNRTAVEFMDRNCYLQTVDIEDIDMDSLRDVPQKALLKAQLLDASFPTLVSNFTNNVARVEWQLNPDGRYYMDDDGFGMTDDEEIAVYSYINRRGKPLVKFRTIEDYTELDGMRRQAERKENGR